MKRFLALVFVIAVIVVAFYHSSFIIEKGEENRPISIWNYFLLVSYWTLIPSILLGGIAAITKVPKGEIPGLMLVGTMAIVGYLLSFELLLIGWESR